VIAGQCKLESGAKTWASDVGDRDSLKRCQSLHDLLTVPGKCGSVGWVRQGDSHEGAQAGTEAAWIRRPDDEHFDCRACSDRIEREIEFSEACNVKCVCRLAPETERKRPDPVVEGNRDMTRPEEHGPAILVMPRSSVNPNRRHRCEFVS